MRALLERIKWIFIAVICVAWVGYSSFKAASIFHKVEDEKTNVIEKNTLEKNKILASIKSVDLRVGLEVYWQCKTAGADGCILSAERVVTKGDKDALHDIIKLHGELAYSKEEVAGRVLKGIGSR